MVTFTRSDQKSSSYSPGEPLFPPDSSLDRVSYFPMLNAVLLKTARGDDIAVELPIEGSPSPLRNRPVIYLDQKDWSSLAKIRYAPERVRPAAERQAAAKLADLAVRRKIILPMSAGHISETCQWTNDEERYQLGLTVAQLSGGWQMRDPLSVRRFEFKRALTFASQKPTCPQPEIFTLVANAMQIGRQPEGLTGDPTSLEESISRITNSMVFIISSIDTLLDQQPISTAPTPGWVSTFQAFTDWLAGQDEVAARKRKYIDQFFLNDSRVELASEAWAAGLTTDDVMQWIKTQSHEAIKAMPNLGLFREVLQEKMLNPGTNWTGNDLTDLMYLTCAAGYAHYVVGERSLVAQMRPALRRLDRQVNVYPNLRSLIAVLPDY